MIKAVFGEGLAFIMCATAADNVTLFPMFSLNSTRQDSVTFLSCFVLKAPQDFQLLQYLWASYC